LFKTVSWKIGLYVLDDILKKNTIRAHINQLAKETIISKEVFDKFLDDKITSYAKIIVARGENNDRSAVGELDVYTSILQVLRHKNEQSREIASFRALGVCDAINDILVELKLIDKNVKFWEL
tara:strand:+ start:12428 stop:12796 length:369 start_codon:yes stop_codon:yes gene_type:complete